MTDDQMEIDSTVPVKPTPPRAKLVTGKKKSTRQNAKRPTVPKASAVQQPEVRAEAPVRRTAPRPVSRPEPARDFARETTRPGAVVAMGHNGEVLTRRSIGLGDKFDIPLHEVPHGWDYQWNTVTVLNQRVSEVVVQADLQMYRNGWRPVPASRHPGRWTAPGYEGEIVVDGLRLEERPKTLSEEAKAEDTMRAKMQVRDRTDALRLTQKKLPGAEVSLARHQAGGMKMSIDPGLDIPKAPYQLEE